MAPAAIDHLDDIIPRLYYRWIPGLHTRIDNDRSSIADMIVFEVDSGSIDIGGRVEPRPCRPQELFSRACKLDIVVQDDDLPLVDSAV